MQIDNLGSVYAVPRVNETIGARHWGLALVVFFFLNPMNANKCTYQYELDFVW
jgi:hypothetical protein